MSHPRWTASFSRQLMAFGVGCQEDDTGFKVNLKAQLEQSVCVHVCVCT